MNDWWKKPIHWHEQHMYNYTDLNLVLAGPPAPPSLGAAVSALEAENAALKAENAALKAKLTPKRVWSMKG